MAAPVTTVGGRREEGGGRRGREEGEGGGGGGGGRREEGEEGEGGGGGGGGRREVSTEFRHSALTSLDCITCLHVPEWLFGTGRFWMHLRGRGRGGARMLTVLAELRILYSHGCH